MTNVSTRKAKPSSVADFADATREPQQGRSRASYERMLTAAEKLMVKRGNGDFTLTEVSKTGKVSIGSIYLRFDSKDDLIRAVHARVLTRIEHDQNVLLASLQVPHLTLEDFTAKFVEGYAELLKSYSPVMRPIMFRAITDSAVSRAGQSSAEKLSSEVMTMLLQYSDDFGRPDHVRVASSAFRMIYCTLARYLGLGSSPEAANEGNWEELKEDLAIMCAAFLRAPAHKTA
jgi:AcrR family transcriptional regulator